MSKKDKIIKEQEGIILDLKAQILLYEEIITPTVSNLELYNIKKSKESKINNMMNNIRKEITGEYR